MRCKGCGVEVADVPRNGFEIKAWYCAGCGAPLCDRCSLLGSYVIHGGDNDGRILMGYSCKVCAAEAELVRSQA